MSTNITRRAALYGAAGIATLVTAACAPSSQNTTGEAASTKEDNSRARGIVSSMTSEQLVSQLIVLSMREWDDKSVRDLAKVPELAEALRQHQYAGVLLYGSNLQNARESVKLINDLQTNNAKGAKDAGTTSLPYLVATTQEGGAVVSLTMGTRGTGNMAIGATNDEAEQNALLSGQIIGEELGALGINTNLAPCADVIPDLTDPAMSTRVFSDDADGTSWLAEAFCDGMSKCGHISVFKHFPGAGDSGDLPTALPITLDQLHKKGLAAFSSIVKDGAEAIMVSSASFPSFDTEQTLGDEETRGHYPACMSHKIVGELLRKELGFKGVVVTDALFKPQFLEDAAAHVQLVVGEPETADYAANIAQQCLEAGCDLLLVPADMSSADAVTFYDDYVKSLASRIDEGTLSRELVEDAVTRILALKDKHGILDLDASSGDVQKLGDTAEKVVGSPEHHAIEEGIAVQAVTLLKNEGIVPIPGSDVKIVILGRAAKDAIPIEQAINQLRNAGTIDANARIENRITGKTTGKDDQATTSIIIDHYYDEDTNALVYTKAISDAIAKADYVICLSSVSAGLDQLQDSEPCIQGVTRAQQETKNRGVPFVLLSCDLPVDASRFSSVDVIACAYLAAGFETQRAYKNDKLTNSGPYNANVPAALRLIFGNIAPDGKMPIAIPSMQKGDNGSWTFVKRQDPLYDVGAGL